MIRKIVIVDDHELMAKALSSLIQTFTVYQVLYEVSSGEQFIARFAKGELPDIVLLDVNMPGMDGYAVAQWLKTNYAFVKVIALSMNDKEEAIVKMLRHGAVGYLLKGCKPIELKEALDTVISKGFYFSEFVTSHLLRSIAEKEKGELVLGSQITIREKNFIELACSDLTYFQIADKMCVSPRTIDGYRESVFHKLDVKSRVGMVLQAIRMQIVDF